MELRQLKTFRSVARSLNFTRAASEMGYAQSSVTAQVKALERELGVRLFDRLGRRVALTDAGEKLLVGAERLLEAEERVRDEVSGGNGASATLRVSVPETLCTYRLPGAVELFKASHPHAALVFSPTATGSLDDELERRLRGGEVDFGLVMQGPPGSKWRNDFIVEKLAPEPLVLVAHPDHALAERKTVEPQHLVGEPVLLTEKGCGYRGVFEDFLDEHGVKAEAVAEFASGEAIKRCAASGMGLAVLAEVSVRKEIEEGSLVRLRWSQEPFEVTVQLVRHRDKWLSPASQAFIDLIRETFGSDRAYIIDTGVNFLERKVR